MANEPENIECSSCGASLRAGAVFCHKCGARFSVPAAPTTPLHLVPPPAVDAEPAPVDRGAISSSWFKEDLVEKPGSNIHESLDQEFQETIPDIVSDRKVDPAEFAPEPFLEQEIDDDTPTLVSKSVLVAEAPVAEPAPDAGIRAKPVDLSQAETAAAMRRKPKLQKEKIEVAWQAPETGFNLPFVIGSILIFVLVILMVLGAFFVK